MQAPYLGSALNGQKHRNRVELSACLVGQPVESRCEMKSDLAGRDNDQVLHFHRCIANNIQGTGRRGGQSSRACRLRPTSVRRRGITANYYVQPNLPFRLLATTDLNGRPAATQLCQRCLIFRLCRSLRPPWSFSSGAPQPHMPAPPHTQPRRPS